MLTSCRAVGQPLRRLLRRASTAAAATEHPVHANLRSVPVSPTLAISEASSALRARGRVVHRFGLGQSPFPVFPPMVEALRDHAHQKDYYATSGYGPLREVIASHMAARTGRGHSADDILVGPGSKELIFLLQLCLDADLVLPSPSWVSYQPQAAMLGRRTLWVSTSQESGWKLEPRRLRRALKHHSQYSYRYPRLLVLNSPSNPTGVAYDEAELEALAEVCSDHGVMVLSDEIYGRLTFDRAVLDSSATRPGHAHPSIARFLPEQTIILDGVSKWAGAGGWRLGAFAFPSQMRWLREVMRAAASETFSSVSAPVQHGCIPAFAREHEDAMARYLNDVNNVLRLVGSFHASSLSAAGASVLSPQGGFYVFPDVSQCPGIEVARARHAATGDGPMTSAWLAADIMEHTGVALLPGTAFGRLPEELTFRSAFVDFDGGAAAAALAGSPSAELRTSAWAGPAGMDLGDAQRRFLQTFCPSVVHGTDKLGRFLHGGPADHAALKQDACSPLTAGGGDDA